MLTVQASERGAGSRRFTGPRGTPDQNSPKLARKPDPEGQAWLGRLRGPAAEREPALRELRELLLRAARFEVHRRRATLPHLRGGDHEDLAQQAANDALLAILGKLDDFRGESRFTTWAYKFALLEAGVRLRRLAWHGRELPLDEDGLSVLADAGSGPVASAETGELVGAISTAIAVELTPHQREVLVALALNGVPIDVLAERLSTSRGALYKTLHDARSKLRASLAAQGLSIALQQPEESR